MENFIVGLIVLIAGASAARSLYRSAAKGTCACGKGGCGPACRRACDSRREASEERR